MTKRNKYRKTWQNDPTPQNRQEVESARDDLQQAIKENLEAKWAKRINKVQKNILNVWKDIKARKADGSRNIQTLRNQLDVKIHGGKHKSDVIASNFCKIIR